MSDPNDGNRSRLTDLEQGDRLPRLELTSTEGGPVSLRGAGRRATVLVVVHSADCPECWAYLQQLDAVADALGLWDARLLALVPGGAEPARAMKSESGVSLTVAAAPDRALPADSREGAEVLIADRWGELYHVARSGTAHDLPGPGELEEWVRYLATQCPECGVPDSPGHGEWAT